MFLPSLKISVKFHQNFPSVGKRPLARHLSPEVETLFETMPVNDLFEDLCHSLKSHMICGNSIEVSDRAPGRGH